MAASLVHVETRSARHALAFAKAFVTDLAADAVCLRRHGEKNRDYCCGAEKHRSHFFLLVFLPAENAFCNLLFRSPTPPTVRPHCDWKIPFELFRSFKHMSERRTLQVLAWSVGSVVGSLFVLSAVALATRI